MVTGLRAAAVAIGGAYTKTPYGGTYANEAQLTKEERRRLSRIRDAERHAVMQNDFASVGAGENRFRLSWGT